MFGFNKRKKYNGDVDLRINNEYGIATRNNPRFPGLASYLKILDNAWSDKMNPDEAGLFVSTLYYCGLLKNGVLGEADSLYDRLMFVANEKVATGLVHEQRWRKFQRAIEAERENTNATEDVGSPDYGLFLIKSGIKEDIEHNFYDIPIDNLTRISSNIISTMVDIIKDDKEYAVSFDFRREIFVRLISSIARQDQQKLAVWVENPASLYDTFSFQPPRKASHISALLGESNTGSSGEEFVPFIVKSIS